jgi:tRNA(Ile)-lysidine synthase
VTGAALGADALVAGLLARCTFPAAGTRVTCAVSGGPDSMALLVLATHAGCVATAHHVDHGLRPVSRDEGALVRTLCRDLGADFVETRLRVEPGSNLEARARDARRAVLPPDAMTGHTLDDQAETVLVNLLRGAGTAGTAAMAPGHRHPLLAVRRAETHALCRALDIRTADDESNRDPRHQRNRVRAEVLPLLTEIARRDVAPLLARHATLARDDEALLEELAAALDVTDARALCAAPLPLARRAVRRWLAGVHPPDLATVDRVLDVARGHALACHVEGGREVRRRAQRLTIRPTARV